MKQTATKPRFLQRLDPAGKPVRTQRVLALVTGLMLFLAGCGMGMMNLYFGTGKYKLELLGFYLEQPLLILLNLLPFVILILLLWLLTGRAWVSFALTGAFTLFYSWAEYWKLMGRSDPIYAEDLTIIKEGFQMGVHYVTFTWQIGLSLALIVAGTLVFFFLFRGRPGKLWLRLGLSAVLLAGSFFMYFGVYTNGELYQSFPVWDKLNQWLECNRFLSHGSIYPFLYSVQSARVIQPEDYEPDTALAVLEQYTTDDIPEDRKVNVIMVMFEAFADLSAETDAITGADPYESYHALRDESCHGQLVTNIFAGGTIDTERCAITGFEDLTSFRRASWSYARYFADQGYAVNGSHPSYESFYSRRMVNENLGLTPYYYMENHYAQIDPNIAKDRDFLPEILRLCRADLETKDYVFSFNVTYQNHGPCPTDAAHFDRDYVPRDGLDETSYLIANNYLSGIRDTGDQMLAMAEAVRTDEAPYILVFFGDHKPWLGDQNSVYHLLGIDVDAPTDESFLTYYSTEYLIWANDAAKEKLGVNFAGEGPMISPCFLMNQLFDLCGWQGPSYMKFSRTIQAMTPVMTTNNRFLENGELVSRLALSDEAWQGVRTMRIVQFYLMRDSGGALPAAQ